MTIKTLFKHRVFTLSNGLSFLRILLTPVIIFFFQLEPFLPIYNYYIAIIAIIISLTDFFDGYFARKLGQETPLGQYLDPLADKICVLVSLTLLVLYRDFPLWLLIFIILREVVGVIGGVFLMVKCNVLGKPNIWGKLGVVIVALSFFLYLFNWEYKEVSIYLMFITFIAGVVQYIFTYQKLLFKIKK